MSKVTLRKSFFTAALAIIFVFAMFFGFTVTTANAQDLQSGALAFVGYSGENISRDVLHEETKINSYKNETPQITFLIHGQGQDATTWANDIVADSGVFSYKNNDRGPQLVWLSN